jgi:hypothetical protein
MLALGCGGGGTHESAPPNGSISVRMVDGPINGYTEINLNVQKVEVASDASGWVTIGMPNRTINLLALTGGVSATLADGATLAAGHYTQMRLVLGSGNTLKLADGTVVDLTTPSGMQSGIKLIVNFDVLAGTTRDVFIDFDAAHSIQVTQTGVSMKYMLRPTIRAVDLAATGSISGTLTDSAGAPLAGAEVTAQTLDLSGQPTVVRRVYTAADGHYTLDLLSTGASYYVVAQPVVGTQAYAAKASGAFAVNASTPTFTYNASFTAAATAGSVAGVITPVATTTEHDVVDLLEDLAPGGTGSATFIVRSGVASVATTETYGFSTVPTGGYQARATRYTTNTDGSVTTTASAPMALTVNASAATTLNFSL